MQPPPPRFILHSRNTGQQENSRIFDCRYDIKTNRQINPTVVFHPLHTCSWPGTDQNGLHRVSAITPNPSDTASHTSLCCVQAHHRVPYKALRSRSSPAPVFLLLSSHHVWLSVHQVLYLGLGHSARLVCNTDSGATGDIEEGRTCIGLSNWCAYAHFVVSWFCSNIDATVCTTIGLPLLML